MTKHECPNIPFRCVMVLQDYSNHNENEVTLMFILIEQLSRVNEVYYLRLFSNCCASLCTSSGSF